MPSNDDPLTTVLAKLQAVRAAGKGYQSRCPAHDDGHASLSITAGDDGRVLLRCHAGCSAPGICDAMGLNLADLFPRRSPTPDRRIVATYDYHDENADLLYQVVRYHPKDFRQRVPDGSGGWEYRLNGVRRVLYRLPALLNAQDDRPDDWRFIVEGEKDADRLIAAGLIATTNVGGAGKWKAEYAAPLTACRVVIIPDRDVPGEKHAQTVAAALAGSARVVKIIDLPGGGKDGSDWMDAGGTAEALIGLAEQSPAWTAPVTPAEDAVPRTAAVHHSNAYRPFPVEAMPDAVAGFVDEGAKALGCDAAYVAMPLLAELASAIGNSRRIRLKGSWTEPAVLWAVVVGDSGTLKSPAFDLALRPVRRRQTRAMKEYQKAQAEFRDAEEGYGESVKAWRKAKPADRGNRPTEPHAPVCERLWCSDTTVEALADRLSNAPRGLLVARDELAGWLASFNQYKAGQGGDVAHWLEMHRAGPLLVDRKTGDQTTIHVPRASICIAGGIQPGTLRRCLTPEFYDNGLAARLLLAMPPKRVKQWTDADIDGNTLDALDRLFAALLSFQPSADLDGEPEPADIELTDAAKDIWVAFYNQHAREQAELDGELSAAWSKLEGYAARLALVVHCVRQAADEAVDAWRCDESSMASGITLANWFGDEAKRVYGVLCETQEDRDRRRLAELVQAKGGQTTVRELSRSSRLYPNAREWEAALGQLAEAGVGRWQNPRPGAAGGHPVKVFHLLTQPAQ